MKETEKWDYKIDGKLYGTGRIIIMGIIDILFIVLAVDQFQPLPNKLLSLALSFTLTAVAVFFVLMFLINRYLFFRIYIGKEGFYYKTNLLNGKYYEYTEIESAYEKEKIYRHGGVRGPHNRTYHYYLIMLLKNGEIKKIVFEKPLHGHEIEVLIKRINKDN